MIFESKQHSKKDGLRHVLWQAFDRLDGRLFQNDDEAAQWALKTCWKELDRAAKEGPRAWEPSPINPGGKTQWSASIDALSQELQAAQLAHGAATLVTQLQMYAKGTSVFLQAQHRLLLDQAKEACEQFGVSQRSLGGFVLQNALINPAAAWAIEDVLDRWPDQLEKGLKEEAWDSPLLVAARHLNLPAMEVLLRRGARWTVDPSQPQALSGLPAQLKQHPLVQEGDQGWHEAGEFLSGLRTATRDPRLWKVLQDNESEETQEQAWELALAQEMVQGQELYEDTDEQGLWPDALTNTEPEEEARFVRRKRSLAQGVELETLWAGLYLTPMWGKLNQEQVQHTTQALAALGLEPPEEQKSILLCLALRMGRRPGQLPHWPQSLGSALVLETLIDQARWEPVGHIENIRLVNESIARVQEETKHHRWLLSFSVKHAKRSQSDENYEDEEGDDEGWILEWEDGQQAQQRLKESKEESLQDVLLSTRGGWNEAGVMLETLREPLRRWGAERAGTLVAQVWVDVRLQEQALGIARPEDNDAMKRFCHRVQLLLAGACALERLLPEQGALDRSALRPQVLEVLAVHKTSREERSSHRSVPVYKAPRHTTNAQKDFAQEEREGLEVELAFETWVKAEAGTMRLPKKAKNGPRRV